ncbi:enoyl-CoA hydratase-related protein [Bradyrhizobium sp. 141]|uniref:enoyl-CoA hydratase-related protein n=1 Tax=Bradyrhizobium sp. 141 TaxID=2782617 RepID=UPI001FFA68D3|nr:enoyl-CoA hydratase-related protein [Bradyrhizobium sp. 141]MCK1721260.1 enoyl-CoA hydratase/isomerase family protein [Bradyrhizobium sp. 141]
MKTKDAVLTRHVAEHVVQVTINRPDARNAVNRDVAQGLEHAVFHTERDRNIWVVILTGAGDKAFCAGADLKAISAGSDGGLSTETGGFAGFVHQPRTKPWIAAVNGFALAGGTEIALACDLIIANEQAAFGLPEVKRGLIASAGGLYRLPRALPKAIALELIMTGTHFDAKRAFHYGLINRLVPSAQLMPEALKLAAAICESAPLAVRASLGVAKQAYDLDDAALREASDVASRKNAENEDYREGPRAFVEKRAPRWAGR